MGLVVADISVARGGVPVLEGLSFRLDAGQALILRGPNGIGKTTLLRTIAGLQPPVAGKLESGVDEIAYASHADGIKGTLTVRENLAFWASVFGTADITSAMNAFDLIALESRPAGSLSAGQKRRLGLARLVVSGRRIWVLDEPTVSLDVAAVEMFADAVRKHLGQGGAALIATHIDLGLEADMLDVTPYKVVRLSGSDDFDEAFL